MKENPEERYSIGNINNYVSSGNNHTRMKQYVEFLLFIGVIEKINKNGSISYRYKDLKQSAIDTIANNLKSYSDNSGFNNHSQFESNELIKRFKK